MGLTILCVPRSTIERWMETRQIFSCILLWDFLFFFFFLGGGGVGDEYVMTSRIVCTREHVRRRENATRKRKNSWLT